LGEYAVLGMKFEWIAELELRKKKRKSKENEV